MDLLQEWANWKCDRPPFVLGLDKDELDSRRDRTIVIPSWANAYRDKDFGAPDKDLRLHLGLLPQPFCGDLQHASIYVLLLNPGLSPHDYYGEHKVAQYSKALLANLKQRSGSVPFFFLDPQYSWHSGFDWWHRKLAKVIESLAKSWGLSFRDARVRLARELASIELVPYHSARPWDGWIQRLRSVALARSFVHDKVVPRVKQGKAIVIVTRQAKVWKLQEDDNNIICYRAQEARAAHLGPKSRGGKAILRHLTRKELR